MFEPFENTITTHIALGKPQYWPATKIAITPTYVEVNYNNTITTFLFSDLVKMTKNDIYFKNNEEISFKLSKRKLNNQELELIKSW